MKRAGKWMDWSNEKDTKSSLDCILYISVKKKKKTEQNIPIQDKASKFYHI